MFAGLAGSLITHVTGLPVTSSSSEVATSCCARCAVVFVHRSPPRTRAARREVFALHCLSTVACVLPASFQYGRVHIVMPRPSRWVAYAAWKLCALVGFVRFSVYRPDETAIGLMHAIDKKTPCWCL